MSEVIRTDSGNEDFRNLVVLLDQYLRETDGEEHAFYAQYNKVDNIAHVVVAYQGDRAAGCGAFKRYSPDTVEIKRMYVRPEYRGQGIAKRILSELEAWAKELGFSSCILETGKRQPEAIALYQRCGYMTIPNYGQYENVQNSVCMEKKLKLYRQKQ